MGARGARRRAARHSGSGIVSGALAEIAQTRFLAGARLRPVRQRRLIAATCIAAVTLSAASLLLFPSTWWLALAPLALHVACYVVLRRAYLRHARLTRSLGDASFRAREGDAAVARALRTPMLDVHLALFFGVMALEASARGEFDDAARFARAALDLHDGAGPVETTDLFARVRAVRLETLVARGHLDAAEAEVARAPDGSAVEAALAALGRALVAWKRGDDAAAAALERDRALLESALPTADVLLAAALCQLARGRAGYRGTSGSLSVWDAGPEGRQRLLAVLPEASALLDR